MNKKNLTFLCLTFTVFTSFAQSPKKNQLKSPDGAISLTVTSEKGISWSVNHQSTEIITPSEISITLSDGTVLGKDPKNVSAKTLTVNKIINTPIYKKNQVEDNYNQLTLNFKGNYGVIFRAYNDGVAYRFFTMRKDSMTIVNEEANFNFKRDDKAFLPFVNDYRNHDKFTTSFEAHYGHMNLS